MTTQGATCSCGQLHLTIEGEPSRISMCHCLECQRRTGAVISNQARFRREQVTFAGKATAWMRTAESGNALTFHFCPTCGSTVYWESEGFPGYIAVAIGNFADPNFPAPTIAVWEESRHPWVSLPPDTPPNAWRSRGDKTTAQGQNANPSLAVCCQLPPAADIPSHEAICEKCHWHLLSHSR
jgi:hypothetical protein